MYLILECLVCALSVLLCAGTLFALIVLVMLVQQGAKFLSEATRRVLGGMVPLRPKFKFVAVKGRTALWNS
jgi:hypothetical protein